MTYQEICSALRGEQMKKEASVKKLASIIGMKKRAADPFYGDVINPLDAGMPDIRQIKSKLNSSPYGKPSAVRQPASFLSRVTDATKRGINKARQVVTPAMQRAGQALTRAKNDAAYSLLIPEAKNIVDYGSQEGPVPGPVGVGSPSVRRQYAPEALKLQLAQPIATKVLGKSSPQAQNLAAKNIQYKLAPVLARQSNRFTAAAKQYYNQVLPNRANAERFIPATMPSLGDLKAAYSSSFNKALPYLEAAKSVVNPAYGIRKLFTK